MPCYTRTWSHLFTHFKRFFAKKPLAFRDSLSEIFTIANLRHTVSRAWTCAKSEFRLGWMKLCSIDNKSSVTVSSMFFVSFLLIIPEKPIFVFGSSTLIFLTFFLALFNRLIPFVKSFVPAHVPVFN